MGGLCAMAVFLLSYKVIELTLENLLSMLAALFLVGVVLFPTGLPPYISELTPLQRAWGEERVETLHFVAAAIFISLLAVISFFFGVREARRAQSGRLSPRFWRRFHWSCVLAILAAIAWLLGVVTNLWGGSHAILIGEWVAIYAFGASWLTKGFEYHYLFRTGAPASRD